MTTHDAKMQAAATMLRQQARETAIKSMLHDMIDANAAQAGTIAMLETAIRAKDEVIATLEAEIAKAKAPAPDAEGRHLKAPAPDAGGHPKAPEKIPA